jgi:hypothetical protein
MSAVLQQLVSQPYKHGFVTDIESETAPRGLSEDVIRMISAKKGEPDWLLQFRLEAYRHWLTMTEPTWQNVSHPPIDYQDIIYYSAPKPKKKLASMDEVDPELLKTFEKLGVPMHERASLAGVAVDVIFDSVSVATTYKAKLAEVGIIFCSISEAVHDHPELVRKYMGSVVPTSDNFYAALNSAVFTDGSLATHGGAAAFSPNTTLLAHLHNAHSSTHCELVALCLALSFSPSQILTDSLVSLQLIRSWASRPTAKTLSCPDRAEIRYFIHLARQLPHPRLV